MRTVKEMLDTKYKHSNFIEPTALVIDALKKLSTVNLSYLIVMDGEEFKGIFSERDYARKVILNGRASKDTMVQEVMTTDLPVVPLTKSVEDCMYQMNTKGTRYLLAVNDENKFEGIITIHDVMREVIANKEEVFDNALTSEFIDHAESFKVF